MVASPRAREHASQTLFFTTPLFLATLLRSGKCASHPSRVCSRGWSGGCGASGGANPAPGSPHVLYNPSSSPQAQLLIHPPRLVVLCEAENIRPFRIPPSTDKQRAGVAGPRRKRGESARHWALRHEDSQGGGSVAAHAAARLRLVRAVLSADRGQDRPVSLCESLLHRRYQLGRARSSCGAAQSVRAADCLYWHEGRCELNRPMAEWGRLDAHRLPPGTGSSCAGAWPRTRRSSRPRGRRRSRRTHPAARRAHRQRICEKASQRPLVIKAPVPGLRTATTHKQPAPFQMALKESEKPVCSRLSSFLSFLPASVSAPVRSPFWMGPPLGSRTLRAHSRFVSSIPAQLVRRSARGVSTLGIVGGVGSCW